MIDLVILTLIFLIGLICSHQMEKFIDIDFYDESYSLFSGISIGSGLPSAEFSPLYALWYYLLSLVENDTVDLFFLNFKAMTILPPMALFLALRTNRSSRIPSFALSLGFLCSCANFPVLPKVSHFAVLLLLTGFTIMGLCRDPGIRAFVLTMTALVTSYVRPEYFVSFVLFCAVLFFFSIRAIGNKRSIHWAAPPAAILITFAAFAFSLGLPIGSGNRSMMAFGQHYALNFVNWHHNQQDPWTEWQSIVKTDFGDAASPVKALESNPAAMARHVFTNLRNLPRACIALFGSTFPYNRFSTNMLRLGALFVLAAGIWHFRKQSPGVTACRIIRKGRHYRLFALFTVILLLPSAVSVTLIAPRQHYLLMMGNISVFFCAAILFRNKNRHSADSSFKTLAFVCLLPFLAARPWETMVSRRPQPNLNTIRFLRSLKIQQPVRILEAQGGHGIYVGRNYKRVDEFEEDRSYEEIMATAPINMIVLSERLRNDCRFINNPSWQRLIKSPSEWGFTELSIPGVAGRSLLIKKELIPLHRNQ